MSLDYNLYLQSGVHYQELTDLTNPSLLLPGIKSTSMVDLTGCPRDLAFSDTIWFQAAGFVSLEIDPSVDDVHGLVGVHTVLQRTLDLLSRISGDAALVVNADTIVYVRHSNQLILNLDWGWDDYRRSLVSIPAITQPLEFLIE